MIKDLLKIVYNKKYFKNFKYIPKAYNLISFYTLDNYYKINLQFNNKTKLIYSFYIERLWKNNCYILDKTIYNETKEPNQDYIKRSFKKYLDYAIKKAV